MNKDPLAGKLNTDTYVDDAEREFEAGFGGALDEEGDRKLKKLVEGSNNDEEPSKQIEDGS